MITRRTLSDSLTIPEWMRQRNRGIADGVSLFESSAVPPLTDDLPMADWQRIRGLQVLAAAGGRAPAPVVAMSSPATTVSEVVVQGQGAKAPPRAGPLTGRPGVAAAVAGAINTVVGGPNSRAPLRAGQIDGVISRGRGRDVHGDAKIFGRSINVDGVLAPPTGRAEVTISNPTARLGSKPIALPPRIRVFTTATGELRYELPEDIHHGDWIHIWKGQHVIGERDPSGLRK